MIQVLVRGCTDHTFKGSGKMIQVLVRGCIEHTFKGSD